MKGGTKKRKKYQTRLGAGGSRKSGSAQGGSGNKSAVAGQFRTQSVSKPSVSKPAQSKGKK